MQILQSQQTFNSLVTRTFVQTTQMHCSRTDTIFSERNETNWKKKRTGKDQNEIGTRFTFNSCYFNGGVTKTHIICSQR